MPMSATAGFAPARGSNHVIEEVSRQVQRVLAGLVSNPDHVQRRQSPRAPYPQLLKLTPVDPATLAPQDDPVVVVGRQLSEQGLGFYHRDPLPHRFLLVVLEVGDGDAITLLIDVSWCRFTRHGWYESGGRFVRVIVEDA